MIKYIKDSYPEKRNIINIIESQEYLKENKKYDFFRYIDYVMSRMNIKTINYKFIHYSFSREDYLYHLFNTISLNKDYIVTFESCVPRIDSVLNITNKEVIIKNKFLFKILINSLSSERCKAIIPMSKNAYNIQNELYKNIDERMKNKLLSKTKILHPPQDINEKIKEFNSEEIVFTFIGSDFYRKGGGKL
ncbi:hypothetical protein WAX88_09090 [Photobacterium damselae subsp. damselae]|uniref:hypothetical protein n=1 Tax=Photobacterium damselae TaxID=38293 RepID=UPI00311B302C